MKLTCWAVAFAAALAAAGCGTTQPAATATAPSAAPAGTAPASAAKAPSSANTGISGVIKPGSKFSKVKLGMQFEQVNDLIGTPNAITRNETGKRWIPFYFGSDVTRMQASYRGEGCLTYTGGNVFGSTGGDLIAITVNPVGCTAN